MSQLAQLKAQIQQISKNVESTANALNKFSEGFKTSVSVVQTTIGGTASKEDTDMIAAFQQADSAIKSATQSLMAASVKAKAWIQKA